LGFLYYFTYIDDARSNTNQQQVCYIIHVNMYKPMLF